MEQMVLAGICSPFIIMLLFPRPFPQKLAISVLDESKLCFIVGWFAIV